MIIVSLSFPQCVVVSAFRILVVDWTFSLVCLMCSLNVSFGSKVRLRILGFLLVGMIWLSMVRVSVLLYSAGSGVKRMDDDLFGCS